jgi:hypothetical protein
MAGLDSIKKAVTGDAENATIKDGTLVTTRGIGVIAVALIGTFLLLDQLGDTGPWHDLSAGGKLAFLLGAGAIWAVVAAADAIARGIATAATRPTVASMPSGLVATRTEGKDSPGWRVAAVELSGTAGSEVVRFLVVKGTDHAWVAAADLSFS